MPRPRKLDWSGENELRKATYRGLTARQVHDHLMDLFGEGKIECEVPEVRAIQEAMRKYRTDPSGPWSITQADPGDIAVLMPVAREVMYASSGRERLTNREADFAVRIRAAAQDLDEYKVWEYARAYILCEERHQSSDHLDLALTWRPEAGPGAAEMYARAIGGVLTDFMVETLPSDVLFSVAEHWPMPVEAGSYLARLRDQIAERKRTDSEATQRIKTKPSSTRGVGKGNRKRESRKKEAPQ